MQAKNKLALHAIIIFLTGALALTCEDPLDLGPWQLYSLEGLPENGKIRAIYMQSRTEGWGCASGGNILRYNGKEWFIWKKVTIPNGYVSISNLDFESPNDGWLVGGKHIGEPPVRAFIMRYDGKDWKEVTPPANMNALKAVRVLSPENVWVAGDGIWQYDGSKWANMLAGTVVRAFDFTSADNGWAVAGFGLYFHWDGSSWTQSRSFDIEMRDDVCFPKPEEGWAVGGRAPYAESRAMDPIYHYDNLTERWKRWGHPGEAVEKTLHAVHFASPDDGWAAGQVVLRWDGSSWRYVPCPFVAFDVFTLGGDEVWLGCVDRKILKYDPSRR